MSRKNLQIHYSLRDFSLQLNSINCRYSMSQSHYGGPWYWFKFSNTLINNMKGVERTTRRPIPKWINTEQFVFWQQSWYEIQFSKKIRRRSRLQVLQDSRTLWIRVLLVFPALSRLDWESPAILVLANIGAWWRLGELPTERFWLCAQPCYSLRFWHQL